jgi:hypothetical protein
MKISGTSFSIRCGLVYGGALIATLAAVAAATAPTASAESCPNQVLRTGPSANLPECRAFEQVTPDDKQAAHAIGRSIAENGEAVNYTAQGYFANPQSLPSFPTYQAVRTATGWTSISLEPPADQFKPGILQAESTDLSSFLEEARPPAGGLLSGRYYIGRVDGSRIDTSPVGQPAAKSLPTAGSVRAFSADLSNLVFVHLVGLGNAPPPLPTDTTMLPSPEGGGPGITTSLYEDAGIGGPDPTYRLVGMANDGSGLISTCGTGLGSATPVHSGNFEHAMSRDGSRVVFTPFPPFEDPESGCVGPSVLEVDDRINGETTVDLSEPSVADCSSCNTSVPDNSAFSDASVDGAQVAFTTAQPLLPGAAPGLGLYEFDFDAPLGERVKRISAGDATVSNPSAELLPLVPYSLEVFPNASGEIPPSEQNREFSRVSADGSHIYFAAEGVLTTHPNGLGQTAVQGASNIYVYERDAAHPEGQVSFVTTASLRTVQTTPDGRYFLFATPAAVTPDDTDAAWDIYRYDAETGGIVRVSSGHNGYDANGNDSAFRATIPVPLQLELADRAISDDGADVFFSTSEPLQADDVNNGGDVYEWHNGQVSLISGGRDFESKAGQSGAEFIGTTASGRDAFIITSQALVPGADGVGDIYDVRVDGGFPAPSSTIQGCVEDACQGPPAPVTPPLSPGTASAGALNGDSGRQTIKHRHKRHRSRHGKRPTNRNRGGSK